VMRIVSPLDVIEVSVTADGGEALLRAIVRAVEGQFGEGGRTAGELVVGLPLNMDGTEGPRAKGVRAIAAKIAERTGRVVHFHDERLSTAEADWSMARSGLTRGQKKAKRDAVAAAVILRDFLGAMAAGEGGGESGGEYDDEPC
jgi:putative holliday junction resolvase